MDNIYEIKKRISIELHRTPNFIDIHSQCDKDLYELIQEINNCFLVLVVDRILKPSSIQRISYRINDLLVEMVSRTKPSKQLILAAYFDQVIDYLKQECIDEELWEGMQNLKNFAEIYYADETK